jgi:hypothetical protein
MLYLPTDIHSCLSSSSCLRHPKQLRTDSQTKVIRGMNIDFKLLSSTIPQPEVSTQNNIGNNIDACTHRGSFAVGERACLRESQCSPRLPHEPYSICWKPQWFVPCVQGSSMPRTRGSALLRSESYVFPLT